MSQCMDELILSQWTDTTEYSWSWLVINGMTWEWTGLSSRRLHQSVWDDLHPDMRTDTQWYWIISLIDIN